MYLKPEELNGSMYAHILNEITGGDTQTILQAVEAAIEEVRSYLRTRYDTAKVFSAEGPERNALILENTKVVTVWNIIKLSNAETIYDMWKERYDRVISYLSKVADGSIAPDLPLLTNEKGDVVIRARFGSNPKFHHSL